MQTATTTITALFPSKKDAKKALTALEKTGIAPENLGAGDATLIEREEKVEKEGLWHRIFHRGEHIPEKDRTRYEDHVRKGATVVAVAAEDAQVDIVVDILNYHGARDFSGEHLGAVRNPKEEAAKQPPSAPEPDVTAEDEAEATAEERIGDPLTPAASYEENNEAGRLGQLRGGVRVYSTASAAGLALDPELDREFQNHHQLAHAGSNEPYERYAPAYRYGARAALEPRFSERTFEAAEPDLQRDLPGSGVQAEWAQVREAVRYGWEKKRR